MRGDYYNERVTDLIGKLKSQVGKNMEIMVATVMSDLGEDRYYNVLRGRRIACENCLTTMEQIDKLEQDNEPDRDANKSYYKDTLPELIEKMKDMVDINLDVIDIDIDMETRDDDNYRLTEDRYHAVLKARQTAGVDTEWALNKIDALENVLYDRHTKIKKKQSWERRIAASE